MTTRPVALPRTYSGPAAFLRQYFYLCMSLVIAVVVVYGFSHTVGQNLLHASPLPPFILTIHAIVFPGWVLFFILQSALVRTRNVSLHRTLGWFGLALGITIPILGYSTAIIMDRFQLQQPQGVPTDSMSPLKSAARANGTITNRAVSSIAE